MMEKPTLKIIRKTWPKIREILLDGNIKYQVDPRRQLNGVHVGGKRQVFPTKRLAIARADAIASETLLDGRSAANMDAELRVMATKGKATLEVFGKTIADAVEFYEAHLISEKAKESSLTVSALVDRWWEDKFRIGIGLRTATKNDMKETGNLLKKNFGKYKILEISKKNFEDYLYNHKGGPQRRYNLRSRFSQFFNWCIFDQQIPINNPLLRIKILLPDKEIAILSPTEAENLMRVCQKDFPQLLAYHALSLFGGLRPIEAENMVWEDIHIDEKQIKVKGGISKIKVKRTFTMDDTLVDWLKSINGPKVGQILKSSNNRGNFEKFRSKLGYKIGNDNPNGKTWPENQLRHSFGTYWNRIHANKNRLSEIMGNSVKIVEKYYVTPVKESDAKKYWAILP
jgi:integrase